MQDVPSDLLHEILRRLPAESLWRLRNVCKSWRRIIDDPFFVRSHSVSQHSNCSTLLIRYGKDNSLYSLSLESLNLAEDGRQTIEADQLFGGPRIFDFPVSACHGLILFPDIFDEIEWVIWNPVTQDFLKLPTPDPELLGSEVEVVVSAGSLGYDHSTDDYKVVRIYLIQVGTNIEYRTLVYSLKLGFWRASKNFPHDVYGDKGVFLDGSLYWRFADEYEIILNEIIMFDLRTEDYTKLQGPPLSARPSYENFGAMGGFLVLSCYFKDTRMLEGWIMRDVNGVWMKLFSFRPGIKYLWPVAYLKEKRLVILQEFKNGLMFLLDLESNTLRKVVIQDMPSVSCMQFFPGTLFRLSNHSGGGGAATAGGRRERAHKRLTIEVSEKRVGSHGSFTEDFNVPF